MKLVFDNKFRFHTSKMNEICLHCHLLYFSSIILTFGQCVMDCRPVVRFSFYACCHGSAYSVNSIKRTVLLIETFWKIENSSFNRDITQNLSAKRFSNVRHGLLFIPNGKVYLCSMEWTKIFFSNSIFNRTVRLIESTE